MSRVTKISWCDATFNPWVGCSKVSPGCAHCYAEIWGHRFGVPWGPGQPRRRTSAANWRQPLRWNKQAIADGIRPRIFCSSLSDWLDDEVPATWLSDLLALTSWTANLDWLLLTKRPESWQARLNAVYEDNPQSIGATVARDWLDGEKPQNILIGWTAEDQPHFDERTPHGFLIPAKTYFVSCEPLLGPIDLHLGGIEEPCQDIGWVICGGESGTDARFMSQTWARSLLDQCKAGYVAFWMKQLGGHPDSLHELLDFPEDLRVRELPR